LRIGPQLQKAHIPLKSSKRTTKKALWLDNKAVRAVQKKRHLYSKYKDNSHPAVESQNKKAKKELIRARRKFEKKLAENIKSDAKSFYAYVRSMSSSKVKPTSLQQQDGTNTSTPKQTCDTFNNYFSSVFTSENIDILSSRRWCSRARKGTN